MRLELARHPQQLRAKHPILVDELLALEEEGKQRGVSMMIKMLSDLHEQGRNSQYLVKLKSSPIWELKSTSRGGEVGGAHQGRKRAEPRDFARGADRDRGISAGRTRI